MTNKAFIQFTSLLGACILVSVALSFTMPLRGQENEDIYLPLISKPGTENQQTITYTQDDSIFPNPERGLFDQNAPLWRDDQMWVQDMSGLREQNVTLIRLYFLIDEFIDRPISDEALTTIEANFTAAREAGVKVIPRFAYNFPEENYQDAVDANLETILAHLDQLEPIFERNSDVIAYMNLGFIGAWGEWHSSSNNHVDDENGRQVNDNTRAIVDKIFEVLPETRMATLRYPIYKQQLYGNDPLPMGAEVFSGSQKARMGALNDCFLASDTDFGTYPSSAQADREAIKDYLNADNLYVPMGGETCNADERAQPFIGCDNAKAELERMRWSALHNGYLVDVLDQWRQEGCFEEIEARLGYRFRLIDGTFPTNATAGESLSIELDMRNDGYASLYNPRAVELILRNSSDNSVVKLPLNYDPRFWQPGVTSELKIQVNLPAEMAAGTYQILLNLPDPETTLRDNPNYSIRLANQGAWEAETGYNDLLASVEVERGASRQTITYVEETSSFSNPERGYFDQTAVLWLDDAKFVLDMSDYQAQNISILRLYFVIDEFLNGPIDADTLEVIEGNFAEARQSGVKLIPRFTYNFPNNDTFPDAVDADIARTLGHIEQLAPILQQNSDVIAYFELGFVGAWGEWHSSSNNHVVDTEDGRMLTDSARAIVSNLLEALPQERAVVIRQPALKQQLYGTEPLSAGEGFNQSDKARTGAMNDCFLASSTDFGTYRPFETQADIEAYKDYLSADNLYLPMGGETCNADERAEPYTGCDNALQELERMRWSALNSISNGVIERWKTEGCYDEIGQRLGYRFVLEQGAFPLSGQQGEPFSFELKLRNKGFAAPYNARGFELIMRHKTSGEIVALDLSSDPRRWLPGQSSNLNLTVTLPADMRPGEYDLLLNLPDPAASLRNNPNYSIQLANQDMWEAQTGFNALQVSVLVD